jgi:hypothetical protein
MAQINPRTFADAKQLGDGIYELILTNWGNRGQRRDPNNGSLQYPPVKNLPGTATPFMLEGAIPIVPPDGNFLLPPIPSLFGIAIAPRSTVDRCILNFPALPGVPADETPFPAEGADTTWNVATDKIITIPEGFVNYGGILATEQILSTHSPLVGQLVGPILIRAHTSTQFEDSYFALDPAGTDTFGTALNEFPGSLGPGFFYTPELRLLLYMTSKGVLPPTKRAPSNWVGSLLALYPLAGGIAPRVFPIMGRRHITITLVNPTGGAATVNARGTFNDLSNFPSTFDLGTLEADLGTAALAAGPSSAVINIENPGCAFLTLTASGGLFSVRFSVTAFD